MPKTEVRTVEITSQQSGRRLDNYLASILKNTPKSFIYRIIRRGEVRVNGSRSRPDTKLAAADIVRIPPMLSADAARTTIASAKLQEISRSIIYEDDTVLIINKPAGFAVHGGSGLRFGVIDIVRQLRPEVPGIELAHRLDRDTSGCLVCAKDYTALRLMHQQLSALDSRKTYLAVVHGHLEKPTITVHLSLSTTRLGGEKRTTVATDGKTARTEFTTLEAFSDLSLLSARIETGRTHQIRVHAAALGHQIAGDRKYGDKSLNSELRKRGLERMFLHASTLRLALGKAGRMRTIEAPLPVQLSAFLTHLRCLS